MKTIEDWKGAKINWPTLRTIIFDEISMIQPALFSLVDKICRRGKRKYDIPFGGIRIILVGDWYQLPPICDGTSGCQFIFQTGLWEEMNVESYNLDTVMRQTQAEFIKHLHCIRTGVVSDDTLDFLDSLGRNEKIPGKHYVKLYSKNTDRQLANKYELDKLESEVHVFKSRDTGDLKYLTDHRVRDVIELKVGAAVMLLWNMLDLGLSNGSLGIVTSIRGGNPVVKFNNGAVVEVVPVLFEVLEKQNKKFKVLASRTQIPLALAYAITVHKSQGLSFDNVEFFCDGIFSCGQFYVGISRGRDSSTMILRNFDRRHIMAADINKK